MRTLVELASAVLGPRITKEMFAKLPAELVEGVQRFMPGYAQLELLGTIQRDYLDSEGRMKERVHYNEDRVVHGTWKKWEKGVLVSFRNFKEGKLEGEQLSWHVNGQMQEKRNCVGGKMHGERTEYWEDGSIKSVAQYDMGKWIGIWLEYAKDGTLRRKQDYSKSNSYRRWY